MSAQRPNNRCARWPGPRGIAAAFPLLLAALCARPVAAADPADAMLWRCWYDPERPAVACRLVHAPPDGGTVPPGLERAPPIVRTLRLAPGRLLGQTLFVPLYAPPIDMWNAVRLARAVLCAGHETCEIEFTVAGPD